MPAAKPDLRGRPILNVTGVKELDERYRTRAGVGGSVVQPPRVILAKRFSAEVQSHLDQGGTVILLAEEGTLARRRRFTLWAQWIRNTGTFIEDHPALGGFSHDGFCAYQFYRLFGDALEALNITERGSVEREKLTPIVWGLCGDYDPALKSDWFQPRNRWKLYRHGILMRRTGGWRPRAGLLPSRSRRCSQWATRSGLSPGLLGRLRPVGAHAAPVGVDDA
jgi:hypothetical protein